jgi:phage terminase large subunit-like protein
MSRKSEVLRMLEQQVAAKRTHRMLSFVPYERQVQFFEMGATKRERLLCAGNQTGKTQAGAYEMACHMTGLYPAWWTGKRFDHAIHAVAAGEGGLLVRDVIQAKLCGTPGSDEDFGTGMIPKSLLLGKSAGHGVSNLFDSIRVKHASGGTSTLVFKTYEAGRSKFQGLTLSVVWLDEEASEEIYSEALARLTGDGIVYTTFTPLLGWTNVVSRFMRDDSPVARRDRGVVRMGLAHAQHFTEEEKERRLAGYPAHERAARENGDPLLGSGAVFEEVIESDISTRLAITDVPPHWAKLWGVDFGIAHPFAAVLTAWDKDADVFYVLDAFKMSGGVPSGHASRMNAIARGVPVSFPHDGAAREKASGQALAMIYRNEGLNMLGSHATHVGGGYSTEAGVLEMLTRMRDGRFKVASHLSDWFEEFRQYHRKDGQIVKLDDDILSATRIAVTARRHAKAGDIGRGHQHSNFGFGGPIKSRVVPSWNPWVANER